MQLPEHGANSRKLYESMNIEMPETVIDFSENCNPEGPPQAVGDAWQNLFAKLAGYPDPDGEPFISAVARFHETAETQLMAGNGAAELLSLLAARYRDRRVGVIDPAFSEYRATLQANGAHIVSLQADEADGFQLPEDRIIEALGGLDALYICTPNNPTGVLPERKQLERILRAAEKYGTEIVLDEAFIDFAGEEHSFIPEIAHYPHVIIVRSMTKMYAVAGIRLGYLLAAPDIIESLKKRAPHWHINGIAAEIGALCLQQEAYRKRAVQHAADERKVMTEFLQSRGCAVTDSKANYVLCKPPGHAAQLQRYLLQQGLVLRHTENYRGLNGSWLRIGMKTTEQMNILREAMARWFEQQSFS